MNLREHKWGVVLLASVLTGCGHTARPPELEGTSKGGWVYASVSARKAGAPGAEWWKEIGGGELDALVNEGLRNSATLEVMAARLEVSKSDAEILGASGQPSVSAEGGRRLGRRKEFETGGREADVMRYAGLGKLGWEVDFWGRVKQLRQSGKRGVAAAAADYDAGRLMLVAEIARMDTARRRYAAEEAVIARSLEANEGIVGRLDEKRGAGIDDDSAVDRQRAEGDSMRRDIENLRRLRLLAELALDRLIGREAGSGKWGSKAPPMGNVPKTPAVLPSELLMGRPDLRAAALRVAEEWHISKAATLDLLPKVKLGGLLSGRTMRITPSINEWVAQVGPSLEIPVWDPERRAGAKRAGAKARLAAAEYREAVLGAFEEVEAAYVNLAAERNILESAQASAKSLGVVFGRTREKFQEGVVSQLEVLEDERRALAAERAAVAAREAHVTAWITLAKALGAVPE